ncbi:MAG TPA: glycosyl transferase [Propionibacteriaceae bacterium]|nr:glycosyl transferase [Propionibacteriaceae bacterium]
MPRKLTVLVSFPPPRPTSNPYNTLLVDALRDQPGVTVLNFSWRTALLGTYDVFHVHWPEILVDGHSPLKKAARQGLFVALMTRLQLTRRPLVRTLHNLELPRGISHVETGLLRWAERRTTLWIAINDQTPREPGRHYALALHGHYRDWYSRHPRSQVIPGRIGFFGMIRGYKNVPGLVRALRELDDPSLSLRVSGRPSHDGLVTEITEAAGDDPRVHLEFGFLDDADLVELVTSSELVVLPYPEMHNSGSAFAALSLGRPVLLPDNEVNRLLADEVGADWVQSYHGELTGRAIVQALEAVRGIAPGAAPNLSSRDWGPIAGQHVAAYREALALVQRTRSTLE